jgi:hypothetical protein
MLLLEIKLEENKKMLKSLQHNMPKQKRKH